MIRLGAAWGLLMWCAWKLHESAKPQGSLRKAAEDAGPNRKADSSASAALGVGMTKAWKPGHPKPH